jgi:serine/threonine-protein kinase
MYEQAEQDGNTGIWLAPHPRSNAADRTPLSYLKIAAASGSAQFSPDGKWVAYGSAESGRQEIYVQGFPKTDNRVQVSSAGGGFARWRRDGTELFYRALDGKLMAASVRTVGRGLEFGTPATVAGVTVPFVGERFYGYDVSADGQRILTLKPENSEAAPLTVLVNWQAGLKK